MGSIPGSGRCPGEGNGNPLQYSCLENPKDRGTWRAIVHEVARVGHDLATKPPPPPLVYSLFSSVGYNSRKTTTLIYHKADSFNAYIKQKMFGRICYSIEI